MGLAFRSTHPTAIQPVRQRPPCKRPSGLLEPVADAVQRLNHVEGVVDGFGHVSVRHPENTVRYLLARSIAPEQVTASDIIEFDLDSAPIDANGRQPYHERFIHGEIYKARPDVNAVVNAH